MQMAIYTYTPANNFTGIITVPYTMQDNRSNSAAGYGQILKITVNFWRISTASSQITTRISRMVIPSWQCCGKWPRPAGQCFSSSGFMYDTNGDGTADGTGTLGTPVITGGVTAFPQARLMPVPFNWIPQALIFLPPQPDFHGSALISLLYDLWRWLANGMFRFCLAYRCFAGYQRRSKWCTICGRWFQSHHNEFTGGTAAI